jgi:hypothetical protein
MFVIGDQDDQREFEDATLRFLPAPNGVFGRIDYYVASIFDRDWPKGVVRGCFAGLAPWSRRQAVAERRRTPNAERRTPNAKR